MYDELKRKYFKSRMRSPVRIKKKGYIGDYKIHAEIGHGSFSRIYKVQKNDSNEFFALKLFNKDCKIGRYPSEIWNLRFIQEAMALSSIKNEHVIPLIDFGCENENVYIIMPMKIGSLRDLLGVEDTSKPYSDRTKPKRLSFELSVEYMKQILNGVSAIHELKYVHRDLKPGNIFLNHDFKKLCIGDMGLVKFQNLDFTRKNNWVGSKRYMSPEQFKDSRSVECNSDVFALGKIFYRMVAGFLPEDKYRKLSNLYNISSKFDDWVRVSIDKKAENRFKDAKEMLNNFPK